MDHKKQIKFFLHSTQPTLVASFLAFLTAPDLFLESLFPSLFTFLLAGLATPFLGAPFLGALAPPFFCCCFPAAGFLEPAAGLSSEKRKFFN